MVQVCRNCDGGNAASQARIESRERALINDPDLRKYFETSVGVSSTSLNIGQPQLTTFPCLNSMIGCQSRGLQQIVPGIVDFGVCKIGLYISLALLTSVFTRFARCAETEWIQVLNAVVQSSI